MVLSVSKATYATAGATVAEKAPTVTPRGSASPNAAKQNAAVKAAKRAPLSTPDKPDQPKTPLKSSEMSEEEKLKEVEKMLTMAHLIPTVDVWGQDMQETLDVMIPHAVNWSLKSPRDTLKSLRENMANHLKNMTALGTLLSQDSLPGLPLPYKRPLRQRIRHRWQTMGTMSLEPDALLAPFRDIALQSYEAMNNAVAVRNDKDVRKYSTASYQQLALTHTQSSKTKYPNAKFIWQLHRQLSPIQVLSLRLTEGYLAEQPPRFGNRLVIHALAKFDTEQSLEIYSNAGAALHTPAEGASTKVRPGTRVPAKKKQVTEYLVMEKRMWMRAPWVFREQIWPSSK